MQYGKICFLYGTDEVADEVDEQLTNIHKGYTQISNAIRNLRKLKE